jgi:hypothetical protein
MNTSLRLIEGIKRKFADEVYKTNILDSVEKKIIEYFNAIGEQTEEEFKKAKSLNLIINPQSYNFLYIRIQDTGLSFIGRTIIFLYMNCWNMEKKGNMIEYMLKIKLS